MSRTHHRTWQQFHVGYLNITVQLDSSAEAHGVQLHQELAKVSRQLLELLDAERIPATWAVSDPAHSAATSQILKSATDHDLAILGDSNWIGPTAGRTRFARELVRRVSQARAAGLRVTTLVPSVASIESHIDLVVKQQITAVCGSFISEARQQIVDSRALHYGVWEVPVTAKMPLQSGWFRSGKRTIWRSIRRTAAEAGTHHLLIDATAIAASGRSEVSAIKWLARRVATLRDRGLVQVETLRSTAARLSDIPAVSPQRSILRAA